MLEINIIDFAFKMLPSIVSIILDSGGFSFTQVARGIEANKHTCKDFESVQDSKFPCVKSGVTALSIVIATISFGMSMIVISHFSGKPSYTQGGILGGIIIIIVSFVYIQKYDSDIFKLTHILPHSQYRILRKFGQRPSLWTNVFTAILISGYQYTVIAT
ncbi:hypothetical protein KAR91_15430 [Candidatus Pacearchaeota archaeon]|nr:hypothetical protein [Candidatus Pacearchaeota archaeon]